MQFIMIKAENQVKVMAWSPLAGGKLFDPSDDKARRVRAIIEPILSITPLFKMSV
jgi:predicted oxidoreductase